MCLPPNCENCLFFDGRKPRKVCRRLPPIQPGGADDARPALPEVAIDGLCGEWLHWAEPADSSRRLAEHMKGWRIGLAHPA